MCQTFHLRINLAQDISRVFTSFDEQIWWWTARYHIRFFRFLSVCSTKNAFASLGKIYFSELENKQQQRDKIIKAVQQNPHQTRRCFSLVEIGRQSCDVFLYRLSTFTLHVDQQLRRKRALGSKEGITNRRDSWYFTSYLLGA